MTTGKLPKSAIDQYLVGLMLAQQKNFKKAGEAFEQAIKIVPKYAAAWNNLGITRRELNDLPGAIDAFMEALAIDPADKAASGNLARARMELEGRGGVRDRERLEKLKKLVRVSKRLKIHQIGEYLDLVGKDLFDRLVDWADQFGFTIDEDVVEFGASSKEDFIAELERSFASWESSKSKSE